MRNANIFSDFPQQSPWKVLFQTIVSFPRRKEARVCISSRSPLFAFLSGALPQWCKKEQKMTDRLA
jgi:hypothetical protein